MKQYEVRVSASCTTEGGTKEWNAFKEYVTADNAAQAKKQLREELKADGYKNITTEAVEVR